MKSEYMGKRNNAYYVYKAEVKNPQNDFDKRVTYNFKFQIHDDMMMILAINNMFNSAKYAFVNLNKISIKYLFSYNDVAVNHVENAIKATGLSTQFLKKVAAELIG